MSFSDPYEAYAEGSVTSGGPLQLVIALYEGTIESIRQAKACLASHDIWGRSKAVNKAIQLLTELLVSLDHEKSAEISGNLQRLYSYVQCRILDAHTGQSAEPLDEAEKLLTTMLEGWQGAARNLPSGDVHQTSMTEWQGSGAEPAECESSYGRFFEESENLASCGVSAMF